MTIPIIPTLPPAPTRGSASTDFNTLADNFVAALPTVVVAMNATSAAMTAAAEGAAEDRTQTGLDLIASAASQSAASASALTAINAPGTSATSTTSLLIGVGAKSLTIQTAKAFAVGQTVVIARTSDPTTQMLGVITAHNSGSGALTVEVASVQGAGTYAEWTISLSASVIIPIAGAADIWAGTDNGKAVTAAALVAADEIQTLFDVPTINWNVATQGHHAKVVLGGDRTLAIPTNMKSGRYYVFYPIQPPSGGPRTCNFPGVWDFGQQGSPTLSTGVNKMDAIRLQCVDATTQACKATFVKAG
ncbi:hypothetical protein [Phenylobacterium sp.]|uniref:hypothetical protein n=1 Tax=Phenylobacterium sp. TaxID=1871053 RepID=UPI002733BC71|nr:hypothetical protein [Phenylobacterium sp.]MDP3854655.1 hypothetical protein [Phenylobacterium sp.]